MRSCRAIRRCSSPRLCLRRSRHRFAPCADLPKICPIVAPDCPTPRRIGRWNQEVPEKGDAGGHAHGQQQVGRRQAVHTQASQQNPDLAEQNEQKRVSGLRRADGIKTGAGGRECVNEASARLPGSWCNLRIDQLSAELTMALPFDQEKFPACRSCWRLPIMTRADTAGCAEEHNHGF